jgi:hypothetical protein
VCVVKKLLAKERYIIIRDNIKNRKKVCSFRKKKQFIPIPFKNYKVVAPKTLCLTMSQHYEETVRFVKDICECSRLQKRVYLDLSNLDSLLPCGTIYFMSTIEQIVSKYKVTVTGCYPNNDIAEQMLQKLGVIAIMGLSERTIVEHNNVIDWHVHQGVDVSFCEEYDDVENFLIENLNEDDLIKVNSGISEAVANACSHGYLNADKCRHWWAFVRKSVSKEKTSLIVVISDLGVGIHKTISKSVNKRLGMTLNDFSSKLKLTKPKYHSNRIKAACELGLSQTGLKNRGKGLPEMIDVTKSLDKSWLAVISGKGIVTFKNRDFGIVSHELREFKEPIKGTIICWQIPLSSVEG